MFIYLMNVLFNMLSHCYANLGVKQDRRERKMYVYNFCLFFNFADFYKYSHKDVLQWI